MFASMDVPFVLSPNFTVLVNYFPFEETAEQLQQKYANGFEYLVEFYDNDEDIRRIKEGFQVIAAKYDLSNHYDNLLLIALYKLNITEAALYELRLQHPLQERTKELANLLLAFRQSERKHLNSFALKTFTNAAKVTDGWAIEWILTLLEKGIAKGQYPIGGFDYSLNEKFHDTLPNGDKVLSLQKLKEEAERPVVSYKRMVKSYHADFCLYVYRYLDQETDIRPDKTKLLSDAQLNFFYELMVLLEMINPDTIDSEPKDYIGSLLRNRIKALNG